jgi:hypothetical protein
MAADRPGGLAPGARLGKYELVCRLAIGGMAEIYLARVSGIEGFEKQVVLKRILPEHASDAEFVCMFLDEARLAAGLLHPNIAQVHDIDVANGSYFFAMEYVHGEDLRKIVAEARRTAHTLPLEHAISILVGAAAGLHHAHEKTGRDGRPLGIVHRDVSPSNVLVTYDGCVKVVDFGIAKAATRRSVSRAGTLKGKVSYMSPEQCRGDDQLDRRSDVFAMGILLYELTTGTAPFQGKTEYAILNHIVNHPPPPPSARVPGYPPALEAIVMKALARDRDQRYSTARDLQLELERFARSERLVLSSVALALYMEELFGKRLEGWHDAELVDHAGETAAGESAGQIEVTTVASPPSAATLPAPRRARRFAGWRAHLVAAAVALIGGVAVVGVGALVLASRTSNVMREPAASAAILAGDTPPPLPAAPTDAAPIELVVTASQPIAIDAAPRPPPRVVVAPPILRTIRRTQSQPVRAPVKAWDPDSALPP